MTLDEHIREWLNSPTGAVRRTGEPQTNRHLLNISEIEVRAGIPKLALTKWLGGFQSLAPVHVHNLVDALEVHGYKAPTGEHNFL